MEGVLQWDDYIERVKRVIQLIKVPVEGGHFAPNAIVGISNGGLVVADIVWREVFKSTPILALWAKRNETRDVPNRYFNNPFNVAVISSFKKYLIETHRGAVATLLLLDDHFGTGRTAGQAISFIRQLLGNKTRILYIPLVARQPEHPIERQVEECLPYAYQPAGQKVFDLDKEGFFAKASTTASYFPYLGKEIRTR